MDELSTLILAVSGIAASVAFGLWSFQRWSANLRLPDLITGPLELGDETAAGSVEHKRAPLGTIGHEKETEGEIEKAHLNDPVRPPAGLSPQTTTPVVPGPLAPAAEQGGQPQEDGSEKVVEKLAEVITLRTDAKTRPPERLQHHDTTPAPRIGEMPAEETARAVDVGATSLSDATETAAVGHEPVPAMPELSPDLTTEVFAPGRPTQHLILQEAEAIASVPSTEIPPTPVEPQSLEGAAELSSSDISSLVEEISEPEPRSASAGDVGEIETDKSDQGETLIHVVQMPSPAGESSALRPRQPAVYRDRRGTRRAVIIPEMPSASGSGGPQTPAEARLRLSLHPIRRTVNLSLVLTRLEGFPQHVILKIDGRMEVDAYDEGRYDDINLPWTPDLLSGELRVDSVEGFQWLRSARRVQIFAADPNEPDLVAVAAARTGVVHAIICPYDDVAEVCGIAASAGSPKLISCDRFQGIPEGWAVLSGYVPAHAAAPITEIGLRPLDPGSSISIELEGGLSIWPKVFAEGHAPRIKIEPVPEGISVSIGGQRAERSAEGGWEASGWDTPGRHTIDVVPGPSLTYEIVADPAYKGWWPFWNAHKNNFSIAVAPWSRAEICGARIVGPAGESVFAAEAQPTMIALGADRGTIVLQTRAGIGVSVGLVSDPPTFLLASSGQRRKLGRVIWLGLSGTTQSKPGTKRPDLLWADAVCSAASRHLPLENGDGAAENAWRKAVATARKIKRQRR